MLNTLKTVLVESLSYFFVLISHDLYCSTSKSSGTDDAQIINNTSSCMGFYEGFSPVQGKLPGASYLVSGFSRHTDVYILVTINFDPLVDIFCFYIKY